MEKETCYTEEDEVQKWFYIPSRFGMGLSLGKRCGMAVRTIIELGLEAEQYSEVELIIVHGVLSELDEEGATNEQKVRAVKIALEELRLLRIQKMNSKVINS